MIRTPLLHCVPAAAEAGATCTARSRLVMTP
jgi:hypothetical protein